MSGPDENRVRRGRKSRARVLGFLASALICVFLVLAVIDGWSRISSYPWELRPIWIVGSLPVLAVYFLSSALGYATILALLQPHLELSRLSLVALWSKSQLGRYVPGNILMVLGRLQLGLRLGVPRRVSLAASVYEQAIIIGTSAIAGIAFLLGYGDLGKGAALWATALIPLVLVALHPRVFRPVSSALLRRAGREPLSVFLTTRQVLLIFAWYAGVIALQGVGGWMLIHAAAGSQTPNPLFITLAIALAFTVSMLAFVFPSGLGVRDGVLAVALAVKLPSSVSVAVAIGYRFALTLVEVAYVGAVAAIDHRKRRRRSGWETAPGAPRP